MSAYKKLNKQDAFITTYTAHKSWAVTGSDFNLYGIGYNLGVTGSAFNSIKQLYYPSKPSGLMVSHSYDYYNQTTLYKQESRNLIKGPFQITIPTALFGTNIQPGEGFSLKISEGTLLQLLPLEEGTVADGYVLPYEFAERRPDPLEIVPIITSAEIVDDGEGVLYVSGSTPKEYVGDIIYPHGTVVITDPVYASAFATAMASSRTRSKVQLAFRSSQPIFTHNYHCRVREFENNFTYNPSVLSGSLQTVYDNEGNIHSTTASISDGRLKSNVTGSEFTPYITTVGLYNDADQLIAVGKLNRPVPKSSNTEMTIIVKIDI